jgi:Asp-tRNA(Asn)/Glu-tRNA(Gln) amidotransferase A subunit family amidase
VPLVNDPYIFKTDFKDANESGFTLAVKDLFHIAGMPTSAGNPDWLRTHPTPTRTSSSVEKLLGAGTKLVGKTITDELAYSLNGVNCHYGCPINLSCPDRLVGGSSSGSALAVTQGSADIGLGTDTGGSIRVPASYNGLFGIRPTHGAIATDEMVALAPSFDTVGWMTRDLDTLEWVAKILIKSPKKAVILSPNDVAVADHLFDKVQHKSLANDWLNQHKNAFNILNDVFDLPMLSEAANAFRVLQGAEIWATHGDWFQTIKPAMAEDIRLRFEWCSQINIEDLAKAQDVQAKFQAIIKGLLKEIPVIVMPTTPGPAPFIAADSTEMNQYRNHLLAFTATAGLCGLPQVHLPLATKDGPPVGVSLISEKNNDLALITLAKSLMENNK